MPAQETVGDWVDTLKAWSLELPEAISEALAGAEPEISTGERHGSWVLRLDWEGDNLLRSAELALTNNSGGAPDADAKTAVFSVRAAASSDTRFASEILFERARACRGVKEEFIQVQLEAAIVRAREFTDRALLLQYITGQEDRV